MPLLITVENVYVFAEQAFSSFSASCASNLLTPHLVAAAGCCAEQQLAGCQLVQRGVDLRRSMQPAFVLLDKAHSIGALGDTWWHAILGLLWRGPITNVGSGQAYLLLDKAHSIGALGDTWWHAILGLLWRGPITNVGSGQAYLLLDKAHSIGALGDTWWHALLGLLWRGPITNVGLVRRTCFWMRRTA